MRARRQGNVHAQGANNDHERANRLEHAHVHSKPKVRGHEQDEGNERQQRRIDRLHNVILKAHLLDVEETNEASEE